MMSFANTKKTPQKQPTPADTLAHYLNEKGYLKKKSKKCKQKSIYKKSINNLQKNVTKI